MLKAEGTAFFLGDNIDTDQILPGYAMSYPPEQLGEAALAGSAIPDFSERVKVGDIIIAGENFGCGSSREQAPAALKACGVGAVIASSFARIFRRNAINIGLPVMVCRKIHLVQSDMQVGDRFQVDIAQAVLVNLTQVKRYPLEPLSKGSLETLQAGGLIEKVIAQLQQGVSKSNHTFNQN